MKWRWTQIQTNSLIVNLFLVGVQVYILWELNGHLYDLVKQADVTVMGVIFGPTIALVWIGREYAARKGNGDVAGAGHG